MKLPFPSFVSVIDTEKVPDIDEENEIDGVTIAHAFVFSDVEISLVLNVCDHEELSPFGAVIVTVTVPTV